MEERNPARGWWKVVAALAAVELLLAAISGGSCSPGLLGPLVLGAIIVGIAALFAILASAPQQPGTAAYGGMFLLSIAGGAAVAIALLAATFIAWGVGECDPIFS